MIGWSIRWWWNRRAAWWEFWLPMSGWRGGLIGATLILAFRIAISKWSHQ
jgi:hypothetical protein